MTSIPLTYSVLLCPTNKEHNLGIAGDGLQGLENGAIDTLVTVIDDNNLY